VSWMSGEKFWLDVVGNWELIGSSAREQCDAMALYWNKSAGGLQGRIEKEEM